MPQLTHEQAQNAVDAALAKAREFEKFVTVVVVDRAGDISAVGRMDRAPGGGGGGGGWFDIAYGLAYTCTIWGGAKGAQLAPVKDENWFRAASIMRGGRMMVADGSLPLVQDRTLIGAIGVAGATDEEDLAIAEAGVAAL